MQLGVSRAYAYRIINKLNKEQNERGGSLWQFYITKKTNNYEVCYYYKDVLGNTKQKNKRGFTSERVIRKWEKEFKMQIDLDLTMLFEKIVEVYFNDIKLRLKLCT